VALVTVISQLYPRPGCPQGAPDAGGSLEFVT